MDALYNALVNGQPEYKEDGTYITHPPSSLQLQAARAIKQLVEINNQNSYIVNQLQEQINQHLFTIQLLNEQVNDYKRTATIPEQPTTNTEAADNPQPASNTESVREGKGEASTVGRSD